MSKNSNLVKRTLEAFEAADEVADVRVQQEQLKIVLRLFIVDSYNKQKAGTPTAICIVIVPIRGTSKVMEMQPSFTDGGKAEFAKNHIDDLRAELYVGLYDFDDATTHMFQQTQTDVVKNNKELVKKITFHFNDTTTREEEHSVAAQPFSATVRLGIDGKCAFENVKFQFNSTHHPQLVELCEKEACRALARQALGVTKRLVMLDK